MADRVYETTRVRAKNIVLRIPSSRRIVSREVVVSLHEGFLRCLPVSRQHFLHVQANAALIEREVREVVREHIELFAQRRGIRVEINKHKPLPGFAGYWLQRVGGFADVRKIPAPRHIFEYAIEMP